MGSVPWEFDELPLEISGRGTHPSLGGCFFSHQASALRDLRRCLTPPDLAYQSRGVGFRLRPAMPAEGSSQDDARPRTAPPPHFLFRNSQNIRDTSAGPLDLGDSRAKDSVAHH